MNEEAALLQVKSQLPQALSPNQKLAFFAMVIGMFMAILDIQIVASSLPIIGAGLAASTDELSWVQTSYLIAEVIIIPMTGFLARCFSTRISYFVAALGFTSMSFMCSLAWNIESMILFRALQGFFGGAMIPTVFGIIFIIFPPHQRPTISVLIGLVVTVAPTLGPTLGGFITELLSWHFMFLLNIIPGIFVCTVVYKYADFDKPDYSLLNNFDIKGIILLTITLGALQYVLEEGNAKGWLENNLILFLSILMAITAILLVWRELSVANPILDLRAFKNKNFALGCIYSFIMGMGLYGAVYIVPLFLFRIVGYSTIQIGFTMMVTGLAQFAAAPIAGKLAGSGIDFRILLAFGFSLFGLGCFVNGYLTAESSYWEFFLPQVMRGTALMFCMIPVNNIALGTIDKAQVQNASGLYNLTRNLGGAIGLAVINSLITAKAKSNAAYLTENISSTSEYAQYKLQVYSSMLEGKIADSTNIGYYMLNNIVQREAFIMTINYIFALVGIYFISVLILLPFTSNVSLKNEPPSGH